MSKKVKTNLYLNTSHVTVNQRKKEVNFYMFRNLNTSHVTVNRNYTSTIEAGKFDLNTSHVTVNLIYQLLYSFIIS